MKDVRVRLGVHLALSCTVDEQQEDYIRWPVERVVRVQVKGPILAQIKDTNFSGRTENGL